MKPQPIRPNLGKLDPAEAAKISAPAPKPAPVIVAATAPPPPVPDAPPRPRRVFRTLEGRSVSLRGSITFIPADTIISTDGWGQDAVDLLGNTGIKLEPMEVA